MFNVNTSLSRYLLLIISGGVNTLAFAPYTLWWLPIFSLAVLAYCIQQASTARQAALYGFSYGLGWFGLGVSWVHVSIADFGGIPLIASLALMLLLVSYLALFPAFAAWLTQRLKLAKYMPLLFAASWTLAEWLRSWLLTGFPWLSLGYSQTSAGLIYYAPLIGETGISFLLAFSAASLAQSLTQQAVISRYSYILVAGFLFVISPLLQPFKGWQNTAESLSVLLVQGNIKQELRWNSEQEWPTMVKYLELTRPHFQADLIIWPEAAIPKLEHLANAYLDNLNHAAFYQNTAVISGILDYHPSSGEAWNNLIVLGKRSKEATTGDYHYGHANRYSKHHLLPIGEFVPFENWLRTLAPIFNLPMSSFSRGAYIQPNLQANGYFLLPAICFEIAFPHQIAANFTPETQILLTVSNDAWFGDSIGPQQHLQIAQMRALEFGRPLVRATNTGVTATINASGQVQQRAAQFTDTVLEDRIQLTTGSTPYLVWRDWPLRISCLAIFIFILASRRQQRNLLTSQTKVN
ncbi:apolipoprotein N-acyltransferase [Rheinheimera sp. MMS21-TC3]|uniref:apolipoprotein N-acyltransferase n=1 Tax=Rheinheimera sp. MMS21-TC3 TaxID=3072790 RepID=UPI0028C3B8B4|nr:apolipoprotein N-acyltransferase [Rheinheimera sp. MMS21-TC3]WNO62053.1 apolipoprotein N-acyltransferase [Rheinheimera sp. MMS21-TC3]